MFFVLHKNKMISYTVAASIVGLLFITSMFITPNADVEVVPAISNSAKEDGNESTLSYINKLVKE